MLLRPCVLYVYESYIFFLFEEEVKATLASIIEKHRAGQNSLKRAIMSRIPVSALLEGEVKIWLKMLHRHLSPRMKARGAWTVEFKWAMSSEIFSIILQSVKRPVPLMVFPTKKRSTQI